MKPKFSPVNLEGYLPGSLRKRNKWFPLFRKFKKEALIQSITKRNKQIFLQSIKENKDVDLVHNYVVHSCSDSIAELYRRYSSRILGCCYLLLKDLNEAQDACMEVFEKIMRKLPESQPQHFSGWVYAISKNHCLEIIRKKKMYPVERENGFLNGQFDLQMEETTIDSDFEGSLKGQLSAVLAQLSRPQRICIELFFLQEKSYKEIAQKTGMTEKEVKSHLQNGKRNMKNMLSPWYGIIKFA